MDKDRALQMAILAEAYEQVARACAAAAETRYVADRAGSERRTAATDISDRAGDVVDECLRLAEEIEAGESEKIELVRYRADLAEWMQDASLALLDPPGGYGDGTSDHIRIMA